MNSTESWQHDTKLALDLRVAVNRDDAEATIIAENAIIERLDIDPDETEQGLTENAVAQIQRFVSRYTSQGWSYDIA